MSTIAIIGAGKMGGAFYRGLSDVFSGNELAVCDANPELLEGLGAGHTSTDPNAILKDAETILIAVKPQSFDELLTMIDVPLKEKLVISIMAGIPLEIVADATGSPYVVRSMPNLGAQVGRSLTAWIASKQCTNDHKETATKIFQAIGKEIEVKKEEVIDSFTALAGSGPAYFFYLTELLAAKAKEMGFDDEQAKLIGQEVIGASAVLLEDGTMTAAEWKSAVASKGGTTEAALNAMEEKGLQELVFTAIDAAKNRSEELSQS